MSELENYIRAASKDGKPPRPGIILAIRMCLLALKSLELTVPARRDRSLIAIVETDRCLPDAVQLVTDCRLSNRTLKLRDMGKMAAAFVDLATHRAVRIAALESANQAALELYPTLEKNEALSLAYRTLGDEDLFRVQLVRIHFAPEDLPDYRTPRVLCQQCGEGIAFPAGFVRATGFCAGPVAASVTTKCCKGFRAGDS